jgi:uncharacterized protein YcbX
MSLFDTTHRASVFSLWRYPVKSMQGVTCASLQLGPHGVDGDRRFGVYDTSTHTVLSAKRAGTLLQAFAELTANGVRVTLPDGTQLSEGPELDEILSHWLQRPVRVVDASSFDVATFEAQADDEHDDSESVHWQGKPGSFVDESPLHLLTTSDLASLGAERPDLAWDVRRFRPNIVVDTDVTPIGPLETGQRLRIGDVVIEVTKGCTRCVMTTRPQPSNLERELDILRHVAREHDDVVGVRARVVTPGTITVGDVVRTLD